MLFRLEISAYNVKACPPIISKGSQDYTVTFIFLVLVLTLDFIFGLESERRIPEPILDPQWKDRWSGLL